MFDISQIHPSWHSFFLSEMEKPYMHTLEKKIETEYQENQCFPPEDQIFRAFHDTPLSDVRVVILGQDPYHNDGQAMGLAFSVPAGQKVPPSLKNIAKEIESELGGPVLPAKTNNGDLSAWAENGVLLLNTSLTVRAHEAGSHAKIGWGDFTDAVIMELDRLEQPIVFMLWGTHAQSKVPLLSNPIHLVLQSAHPSPLSARKGFFGNGHFRQANEWLSKQGSEPIDWLAAAQQ